MCVYLMFKNSMVLAINQQAKKILKYTWENVIFFFLKEPTQNRLQVKSEERLQWGRKGTWALGKNLTFISDKILGLFIDKAINWLIWSKLFLLSVCQLLSLLNGNIGVFPFRTMKYWHWPNHYFGENGGKLRIINYLSSFMKWVNTC